MLTQPALANSARYLIHGKANEYETAYHCGLLIDRGRISNILVMLAFRPGIEIAHYITYITHIKFVRYCVQSKLCRRSDGTQCRFTDRPVLHLLLLVQDENACHQCGKRVYPMEKITADEIVYHKTCFRCAHCNRVLR